MRKIATAVVFVASILLSQHASAFADQGPNNAASDDDASRCNDSPACVKAVAARLSANPPRENGLLDWILVVGIVVFAIKVCTIDRKK